MFYPPTFFFMGTYLCAWIDVVDHTNFMSTFFLLFIFSWSVCIWIIFIMHMITFNDSEIEVDHVCVQRDTYNQQGTSSVLKKENKFVHKNYARQLWKNLCYWKVKVVQVSNRLIEKSYWNITKLKYIHSFLQSGVLNYSNVHNRREFKLRYKGVSTRY